MWNVAAHSRASPVLLRNRGGGGKSGSRGGSWFSWEAGSRRRQQVLVGGNRFSWEATGAREVLGAVRAFLGPQKHPGPAKVSLGPA
jgi:hypothetical protein